MKAKNQLFLKVIGTALFLININSYALERISPAEDVPRISEVTVRTFGLSDTAIFIKANQIPAFIAKENQDLSAILEYMQITSYQFALYNDLPGEIFQINPGVVYYLRPKKRKANFSHHYLRPGETLWDVSQLYGIRLKSLLKINRLSAPFQVTKGQKISLQKRISNSDVQQVDAQLAASDVIDPWLHLKQRFLIDYEDEKTVLSGKALVEKTNDNIINDGIHKVKEGESIYTIARNYGITVLDIIAWNGFDKNVTLKQGEQVFVSNLNGKRAAAPQSIFLTDNQDRQSDNILLVGNKNNNEGILNEQNQKGDIEALNPEMINTLEYKAKKGDYVYKLSDIYKVMPDDIIRWNSLKGKAWLYVDDKVLIKRIEGLNYNPRIHTVKKGETLYAISGLYKASVKDLTKWNDLDDYMIYQGQDLIVSKDGYIPRSGGIIKDSLLKQDNTMEQKLSSEIVEGDKKNISDNTTIEEDGHTFHKVQEGETIYTIAFKYGQTIENLREWNSIPYGQGITKGQRLIVKKGVSKNLE